MTVIEPKASPAPQSTGAPIVNDFSITIGTRNGSGSQTANATLLRALFKMGIPVSGKNLFPSNIQGLPTWYTIRASKDGFTARRVRAEILVAMNKASVIEDVQKLESGGTCIYAENTGYAPQRDDVTFYKIPADKLANASGLEGKLKSYAENMTYVGVLAYLLGIDMEELKSALNWQFKGKTKAIEPNLKTINASFEWAKENLVKTDPFRVERMDKTQDMMMIDGNTAAALGAIYGGVSFVAWYPITPATSVAESLNTYLPQLRTDPETKKLTYSVIQAEDELAAIGMILGAGWAGARAMTSTSGPGISLMSEFAGYGYFAEIPAVIWDIQRMGPSTGLPTRVSQGDVLKTYWLGHGDTKHVVLLPGSVKECFEFGWRAFDLAERLQTPVFVLSDLDIGMNQWMTEPFEYPDHEMDRGKVLTAEDLNRLGGKWARYRDPEGDGIGPRTLPGADHPMAAYFTRGTGHTEQATYSERPEDWEKNMERLNRKFETARTIVPAPIEDRVEGAEIGVIGYGSTDPAIVEARSRLAARGVKTSYMRLRALPLSESVGDFIRAHDRVYVVELNTDAQMLQLLRLDTHELAARIVPLNHNDGLPLTARWITEAFEKMEA
ncbi:MAG TPA: 2-oxoacid:acceptor oxidoreductase subunit alpha [Anaerolineales bacterium]|nr:2-oxoacid:acceptor oxidoreductase subunit alpha [Anaerolineales bacterium]